jgi:hypothetical protein
VIEPYAMATIYWSQIKGPRAFDEVSRMIEKVSARSKPYWTDVLTYLEIKKNGKKDLQ